MIPWHKVVPDFYLAEKRIIREKFPTLEYREENSKIFLSGIINLDDMVLDLKIVDSYEIEIEFPYIYPALLPTVREVGGRKEKIVKERGLESIRELHFNPRDGSACLCLRNQEGRFFPLGSTVETFLYSLVIPFFYGLSYFERTGKWPWGHYSHGANGIVEFYCEKLGTQDLKLIVGCVELLVGGEINEHDRCPCGSTEQFRKCHPAILEKLRQLKKEISPIDAKKDLEDLSEAKKFSALRNSEARPQKRASALQFVGASIRRE